MLCVVIARSADLGLNAGQFCVGDYLEVPEQIRRVLHLIDMNVR